MCRSIKCFVSILSVVSVVDCMVQLVHLYIYIYICSVLLFTVGV